jgi:hypothetical protein
MFIIRDNTIIWNVSQQALNGEFKVIGKNAIKPYNPGIFRKAPTAADAASSAYAFKAVET